MTITTTNWRAGFAALLATGVLLLGACSDGDGDGDDDAADDETSDEAEDQSAAEGETPTDEPVLDPDAPAADSDFCKGAIDAISMEVDPEDTADDASLSAAEDLEAPEEIREEWTNVLETSRAMATIDYTDPAAAEEQASAAYEDIADDQAKVIAYLQSDCGIALGAGAPPDTVPDMTTGG